jgi:3-hydroxyacyl-[acyl-carrier-protein] dehydratase
MPPLAILDPAQVDFSKIVFDVAAIEAVNPHRHGMRMLDGVVYVDRERHIAVGYKDCRNDEFWVRGHMPGYPILPGVLMVEAAAQLASVYTKTHGILKDDLLGLGGIENTRYRGPVHPGDRLILVGKGIRVDRRLTQFSVQGYVGSTLVFHGDVMGVPIPGKERVRIESGAAAASAAGG